VTYCTGLTKSTVRSNPTTKWYVEHPAQTWLRVPSSNENKACAVTEWAPTYDTSVFEETQTIDYFELRTKVNIASNKATWSYNQITEKNLGEIGGL